MNYFKRQLIIILQSLVRPFKSFEILRSKTIYPIPLALLFGTLWLEAVRQNWFYYPLQTLHSMLFAKIFVIIGICIAIIISAAFIMLIINTIGGSMSFTSSVNVISLAMLPYSLYFLLLYGILMAAPVNTVDEFARNNPNTLPFFIIYIYRAVVAFSVIRMIFGAVINTEQR